MMMAQTLRPHRVLVFSSFQKLIIYSLPINLLHTRWKGVYEGRLLVMVTYHLFEMSPARVAHETTSGHGGMSEGGDTI